MFRWVGAGLMIVAGALAGGLAATSHVARAQTLTRAELTTVTSGKKQGS